MANVRTVYKRVRVRNYSIVAARITQQYFCPARALSSTYSRRTGLGLAYNQAVETLNGLRQGARLQ